MTGRPECRPPRAASGRQGPRARGWPAFDLEAAELALSGGPVAGIDEAGRGPWAGPVVAAAVVLDPAAIPPGIRDSKMLSGERRAALCAEILASARDAAVGAADAARIDSMNILEATLWAMGEAVAGLKILPRLALVDGSQAPRLPCPVQTVVGGDAVCLSVAAASIVAKVTRDRMMTRLGAELPGYGFERHKGYGTPEHRAALLRLGVTEHHRRSFRPVREIGDLLKDGLANYNNNMGLD